MRERSFWGWGWADMFPDEAGRKALAARVSPVLTGGQPVLRDPPRIDGVDLPEPRLEAPAPLAAILSADRGERIRHTYGRAYRDLVRGFAGDFQGAPDLVARPANEEQVEKVL